MEEYPANTVAKWMGHDPAIMVRNYLTNPDLDAHFQHATKATRNPTRKEAKTEETTRNLVGMVKQKPQ